jgi:GNAT superfamily N-acetyltransferase
VTTPSAAPHTPPPASDPRGPSLRELAEEPDHFLNVIPAATRRHIAPGFTILFAPSNTQSSTSRIRTTVAELDDTLAEVRRTVREAGYLRNVWHVGPSCRPTGLRELLLARGFVPATRPPHEPTATAMAMASRPEISAAQAGIEVRLVRDVDEFRQVIHIAMEAFNEAPEDAAGWYEAVPSLWASHDGVNRFTHVAFLDGRPVGFGFGAVTGGGVLLGGSGVVESARGRGVYRALIAARWEEAMRLGKQGLIIHAGSMSRPILERCGFELVCDIDVMEDVNLLTA